MNNYCDTCQRTVGFSRGYRQWYNPSANKFWTAFICDKCGEVISHTESEIDLSSLVDRHPVAVFFLGLLFGLIATPLFVVVSQQFILSMAIVWGVVALVTIGAFIISVKNRATRINANTFDEVLTYSAL